MAKWVTPIMDRTEEDVKAVDRTILSHQKGALNASDLNRIENNYRYILGHLESDAIMIPHSYKGPSDVYAVWNEKDLPWYSEINRIRANYNALVWLFLVKLGLPTYSQNNYLMYTEVNDWERIAEKGKEMAENMEGAFRYCNQHICNEGFIDSLPYDSSPSVNRLGSGILGAFTLGYSNTQKSFLGTTILDECILNES